MKTKNVIVLIFAIALISSCAMSTMVSAKPTITQTEEKCATAHWTVVIPSGTTAPAVTITMSASFTVGSKCQLGNGPATSLNSLAVSVTHPFGTSSSTVSTFTYTWCLNHVIVTAKAMPFNIHGTTYTHDITIEWNSNPTTPCQLHASVVSGQVLLTESQDASATITITGSPSDAALHPGSYLSDQASIGCISGTTVSK